MIGDAGSFCRIYNHYVENSVCTFETDAVNEKEMEERILRIGTVYPWVTYEESGKVKGYAYATRWKERSAYEFTAECAVYADILEQGKGIGTALYGELIKRCTVKGLHLLIAGIVLPNASSIKLHESMGFVFAGTLREAGKKFGQWLDVGYWTLKL